MRLPPRKDNQLRAEIGKSVELIRYGMDLGINYIDTAWTYHRGDSEKIIGKALKDGYRQQVYLVTKLPMAIVRDSEDFDRYLTAQMKRLQTDYLDGYFFHALDAKQFRKVKRLGLIDKMEKAKKEGLIRSIGFSFHDTLQVFKEIVDYYPWAIAQIQYNYVDTCVQATTEGLSYAHGKGIAVVIMEPIKGGILANPSREALGIISSAKKRRSPVDWALQFLWNQPEISVVLSGMGSKRMIRENCASADRSGVNSLSLEDQMVIQRLSAVYHRIIVVPCTGCGYCMPCPEGVKIPSNFAFLNSVFLEKNRYGELLKEKSVKKPQSSKDQLNSKFAVRNAKLCIKCRKCVERCPQNIDIPKELERVQRV